MNKPWFNCEERIRTLRLEAERWRGTPFRPNSNTPGPRGGASCQKLVSEIYKGCGWKYILVPDAPMAHGRFVKESLVVPWMDSRQEFERVDLDGDRLERIAAGDMLGFTIGQCVHHCAIYLGEKRMVHCIEHIGVQYPVLTDVIWWSRWARAWRPLEEPR